MSIRTRSLPLLAALSMLAVVAFGATACSSTTPTASAAESVRSASTKSAEAESVAFEMSISMDGIAGMDMDMESEGVYDLANGQMQMTMAFLGQEIEAVTDGSTLYLKMPMLGDGWVKQEMDLPANGSPMGAAGEDPTKVLEWLTAAGNDVEEIGKDDVRGEEATHYRATLDLTEAAGQLSEEQREALEQAIELMGQDTMEVDLWVNGDGLPVRLTYEMSFANSGVRELEDVTTRISLEYFDWGKPVSVTLPDPSEVQDANGVFGAFMDD